MSLDNNQIQIKSKAFAIKIVRLVQQIQHQHHEYILTNQIKRSGTSIGANVRESRNAQSKADFVSKLQIALKEADETDYWLDILHETDYVEDSIFNSIKSDNGELIALLTSIIKSSKT